MAAGPCRGAFLRHLAGRTAIARTGAQTDEITVSGLSSGGYMAVQYQVAHSSSVAGAGVIAGGPYGMCCRLDLGGADALHEPQ